jgi:hypothetical protein
MIISRKSFYYYTSLLNYIIGFIRKYKNLFLKIIEKIKMTKENTTKVSFIKPFKNFLKRVLKLLRRNFITFNDRFPDTVQVIQISFIYYFAFVDLVFGILSNVLALGSFPELLKPVFPVIRDILQNPFFQMWNSPEKIFFLSFLVLELMITRPIFKFSKLIQYNVLLIFALLMIQGLVISYWDVLFHREVANGVSRWILDDLGMIQTDRFVSILLFFITFLVFLLLYFYLYTRALQGKFATFPGLEWLTDSIAFWLKIKTPTMRLGFRKKKKGGKK